MCGIAGIFDHLGLGLERLGSRAEAMARTLGHRGPDDHGLFVDRGIAMSHTRLSVLDLSRQGAQPMLGPKARFALILNGEIYNHLELRRELGPDWRGTSDTETLLAALMRWGVEQTLSRLTGMFAFAFWDALERTLVLARDRFGEKPLYYGDVEGGLTFGSELKALRAVPGFDPAIDRDALALYLRFSYLPEPHTIYKCARKLPPGHFLVIHDGQPLPQPEPYWTVCRTMDEVEPFAGSQAEALAELDHILRRAVAGQMLSDVPLGALLSGGVDSSLVTAIMQAQSDRPVRTFTIGYEDQAWDESKDAEAVAAHLGCDHTSLIARPEDALALVAELPRMYDEPFADASQLPTALVCRLTREHVTVALSGDGGDELFAGYNRHSWGPRLWEKFRRLPRPLRAGVGRVISILSPASFDKIARQLGSIERLPGQKLHKLAGVMGARSREAFYKGVASTWADPAAVLQEGTEPRTLFDTPEAWPQDDNFTAWMQFMDASTYLPGDILTKVDRAAMAASLETRAPYLDHTLAAFAWSLPSNLRVHEGQGKHLLRELLYTYVPRELVERPKMGFGVPVGDWLTGPLRAWAEELLDPARLAREGFFRPEAVKRSWLRLKMGRSEEQFRLWNLLMFQAWLEEWS
ncbi:MAG: asparagine synthase (glutamine-hydrolyzing) [Proteobacteria bacterium]|nr:asparagine synthase (glutamine-hydrolyzing) [Pseudomonadota bacterium]